MAYINVAEWSPDQVTDWLKGLDNSMYKYINSFTNNEVKGHALLNIRPYELNELGMYSIGHQEIVLEAVEQLRNFNYNLEKENLQFLALQVATTAKNLHRELAYYFDKSTIETQILNDITRAISTIKPLVAWLDRSPFQGQLQFNEIRKRILRLGIEMATSAQRDRFVENPVDQIRLTAEKLSKLADYIIQDISDPIILQPATLNLVTLKKRESELGFNIVPNYHGIHVIADIKCNSPAAVSGKIEDGDEIIQINYQTVIGWHYKRVLQQLQESPPDVLLTLKKRPKHIKIYGQIYMKPYRLPSKKRALPYRLSENLPSPRIELIPSQNFPMLLPLPEKNNLSDSDSSSSTSSILITDEPSKGNEKDLRLYLPKPRAVLQRRNTICGDQASGFRNNIIFWHEINNKTDQDSQSLRDKSVSFGFGLETMRPTTYIGIHNVGNSFDKCGDLANALKSSLPDIQNSRSNKMTSAKVTHNTNEGNASADVSTLNSTGDSTKNKYTKNKVVKFNTEHDVIENKLNGENGNNAMRVPTQASPNATESNELQEKREPVLAAAIRKHDSSSGTTKEAPPLKEKPSFSGTSLAEAINVVLIESHQQKTNAATQCSEFKSNEDKPPEIGPRKEYLKKKAPILPPRPSKAAEVVQSTLNSLKQERAVIAAESSPTAPFSSTSTEDHNYSSKMDTKSGETTPIVNSNTFALDQSTQSIANTIVEQPRPCTSQYLNATQKKLPATKHFLEEHFEGLELLTPNKTKTLTLKKKNSILAKRRKVSLKALDISDIQGHLFRRMKNKDGVTDWAKYYFVLVETVLYGFRDKKSTKASCLIFLPGFTVSLAKEVRSKPFAYKVYHPKKTFYFAAESQQALDQWIDYIKRATLKGSAINVDSMLETNIRDLFSETDSSNDEDDKSEDSVVMNSLFSSMPKSNSNSASKNYSKKRGSSNETSTSSTNIATKPEKYHLGFGSLKKFNKHNLSFSSYKSDKNDKNERDRDEKKKISSDVPVPTAQFRSYRKMPDNAGMQLGSSSMMPMDYILSKPAISSPILQGPATPIEATKSLEPTKNTVIESVQQSPSPTTVRTVSVVSQSPETNNVAPSVTQPSNQFGQHVSKLAKCKTPSFNYIHASNPNLVEFTFQTSKTLDYSMPKVNASNCFDGHQNLISPCMTLKDLMLRQEEAEAYNMYDNRVNMGVEKMGEKHQKRKLRRPLNDVQAQQNIEWRKNDDENSFNASNGTKKVLNKIQSRSLPKTPDYAQSFKADDSEIIMARSKEGQKLRDFGYEFISGDDATNDASNMALINMRQASNAKATNRQSTKRKGLNWMHLSGENKKNDDEKIISKGSFKSLKNRIIVEPIGSIKSNNSEHSFKSSFKDFSVFNSPDDSCESGVSTSLPVNKKTLISTVSDSKAYVKERGLSHSLSHDHYDTFHNGDRKNSVERNVSYFTKLSFPSSKTPKEKRLLGSPRLHRAIFGRKNPENQTIDHESFSPMDTTNKVPYREYVPPSHMSSPSTSSIDITNAALSNSASESPQYGSTIQPSTDSNIEYPPVFEPETYSLCDPTTSLTLFNRNRRF